jgi:hypothetical protein
VLPSKGVVVPLNRGGGGLAWWEVGPAGKFLPTVSRPYQDRMLNSGPSLLLKALKFPGFLFQEKEILHTHTHHTPHFATIAAAGRRAHRSCSSAHLPAVVVQHECCLNVVSHLIISQCTFLSAPLRKDSSAGRRRARRRLSWARLRRRRAPQVPKRGEGRAIVAPPAEYGIRVSRQLSRSFVGGRARQSAPVMRGRLGENTGDDHIHSEI